MNVLLLSPAQHCFPYSVIYNVDDDELLVIAIAHQHRKPGYWRGRLQGA